VTAERWERIKQLFDDALRLQPPEREAFLAAAAADQSMHDDVVRLIAQYESAGDLLEVPPFGRQVATIIARERMVFAPEQIVASRFRIVRLLGQGGMGEVYEAFDLELRETIALKTIRSDLAADVRYVEGFKREVHRSRAITHPNVCRVYDLFHQRGQSGDVWFLTMELLRGETLAERLRRAHRFSTVDALPLVKQMCDALGAAHHHGVVHRDFKSGNVVLVPRPDSPDIRVVITDFGLARPTPDSATAATSLDVLGEAVGTPAYMAPEQVEGRAATAASDVYALGVVMYEMVTGTLPFAGDSPVSVAVRRLSEPPEAPRAHVADLDPRWELAIMRCLERDPASRFAQAAQVAAALQGVPTAADSDKAAARQPRRQLRARTPLVAAAVTLVLLLLFNIFRGPALAVTSIAVVPFVGAGGDRETEYVSDGVTEGVIDSLAQLPQQALKVIAFNSVMRYKGHEVDARAVGRELNVGAVVVGRVLSRSDTLSINAELVNAADQSRLWGTSFNAQLSELPAVQQQIADKIADTLRVRQDASQKRSTKRRTSNSEAYRLYLKGRFFWNQYTEDGWRKALEYFNQALAIDPDYAQAWAGLADTYYQLSSLVLPPAEAIPRARAAATRALAVDEGVAEAHASLGIIHAQYDWNARDAEKEFRRALALNANYATAHQWYGMLLYSNADFESARREFDKALELDPLSLIINVTAVWPLRHLGQDDRAITQVEKIIEMFPNVPDLVDYVHEMRGEIHLQRHEYDQAVVELVNGFRIKALCGNDPQTIDALRGAYAASGLDGYWRAQLDLATRRYEQDVETSRRSTHRYVSPYRLAELNARVGRTEQAFALLEDCVRNRDENLRWLKAEASLSDSPWQSLRADPRFAALLDRIGLVR
jgi:eukaryotic-like serine/threonine-protein kinase